MRPHGGADLVMSDMGVISTNLYRASKRLMPYIWAMDAIRSRDGRAERQGEFESLLGVLAPLDCHLRGEACFSPGVDGRAMSEFLRLRHREGWPGTKDAILSLTARLNEAGGAGAGAMTLSDRDMSILGDVGDALDDECTSLFEESRRR